jgi:FAD/FMN-containing dehydrogenase
MLNPADAAFSARMEALLPPGSVGLPDARHLVEPRGRWQGHGLLLRPRTTADVSRIVQECAASRVGIVPWGGGTGLVGGQIMPDGPDPVILSLERMDAPRALHGSENVMTVEAGMILADVHAVAAGIGRWFPLWLASEGSARIGGLLATNAGGINVVRYGNARDLCLGVEAVLPDGSVMNGLTRLRKNNMGYDLRHLLIGSEGTLGIITAASLRLFPAAGAVETALLTVPDPKAALDLLELAQTRLPGMISAFELIHRMGFDFIAETMPDRKLPFDVPPEWSVLIEIDLPPDMDAAAAMAGLYALGEEKGLIRDGLLASSVAQRAQLWHLREDIPAANRKIGSVSSHDISLPLGEIPGFVATAPAELAKIDAFRINCFGHLGDGNLHYNVFPVRGKTRADHDHQRDAVKMAVHDLVHALGGSVSAEHGIGRLKVDDLERYGDPTKLAAMRAIKAALDPKGIMNPGAVLRALT